MQQETAGGVALLPRPRPVTARMQPRPPCSLLILPHLLVRQEWLSARRGGFFGGDAVSEVGGGLLAMKLRPLKAFFLTWLPHRGRGQRFRGARGPLQWGCLGQAAGRKWQL